MCLNNNFEGEKMFRLVLMGPCVRSGSPSYLKREELPFPFCRPAETPAPVLANQNKKEKLYYGFPKRKGNFVREKKKGSSMEQKNGRLNGRLPDRIILLFLRLLKKIIRGRFVGKVSSSGEKSD